MGLLNRIFGKKKDPVKELLKDIEFCKKVWINYLMNFSSKEQAAQKLLTERGREGRLVNSPELVIAAIKEIENQIPKEFIDIEEEKRKESQIIKNLEKLTKRTASTKIFQLKEAIQKKEKTITATYGILKKLAEILSAELHAIKLINQNPTNSEAVYGLYKLIVSEEYHLIGFFKNMLSRKDYEESQELIHRILAGEEIEKERETEEEKLIKDYKDIISDVDSEHELRELALGVYEHLKEEIDFMKDAEAQEKLNALVEDDKKLREAIKTSRPNWPEKRIKAFIEAFRYAYYHVAFI